MIRLFLTFAAYMVIGQWVYAEIKLSLPQAIPAIDYALETVRIPTHDQWDKKKIEAALKTAAGAFEEVGGSLAKTFTATEAYAEGRVGYTRFEGSEPGFETF